MEKKSSFRALVAAFATAGMLPLIESIGVVATNVLFALIGWLGYVYVSFLFPRAHDPFLHLVLCFRVVSDIASEL